MRELISFVIPCYGSEFTIEDVVEELITEVNSRRESYDYEIILVNDCSPDNVWEVIKGLVAKNSHIFGISLARNFGQHAALMAGYSKCNGNIIFSLDDDGQAPIESVYPLIDKLNEGYDAVSGKIKEIKQSTFRILGSYINKKMCEFLLGQPKNLGGSSFWVARRFVIDEMLRYNNSYPYIGGLLLRTTRNIANVEIDQRERQYGSSNYNLKKLIKLWLNGFTAFSEKPLRIATFLGMICAALGFGYGLFIVIRKFMHPGMPMGYSSVMAAILFIGGMIMLLLGMIGEYIGRIYISINNAPQYVIREMTGDEFERDMKIRSENGDVKKIERKNKY